MDRLRVFLAIVSAVLEVDRDDLAGDVRRQPDAEIVVGDVGDVEEVLALVVGLDEAEALLR